MKTKTEATTGDLYHVPENRKAELVNGEIILMSPTGKLPNYAAGEIFVSLHQYARQTGRGHAATDNLGFIVSLPNRRSFSPDVSFYEGVLDMKFGEGAPLFAVEVRSEGDYGRAADRSMADKRADYFTAGTLVVWDVDLLSDDIVRVYRKEKPKETTVYRRGQVADSESAVHGWTMHVDSLYPASNWSISTCFMTRYNALKKPISS